MGTLFFSCHMAKSYKSPLPTMWQLVPYKHVREKVILRINIAISEDLGIRVVGKYYPDIRNYSISFIL